jgi:S1-C subfamily serine protease
MKIIAVTILLAAAGRVLAAEGADFTQKLYKEITPSLVAVQWTYEYELGRRDLIGAAVVISEDGMVMAPLALLSPQIPDEQMKDFKIIVPRDEQEPQEIPAIFVGRDERTGVAFLKAKEAQKWKPIKFEDAPIAIGDTIYSVGLLPKAAGYRSYLGQATVSCKLRGEMPTILVTGAGLPAVGSPIFNAEGKAIGVINAQSQQQLILNDPTNPLAAINNPPRFFVPTSSFQLSLDDPIRPGEPQKLPWMGVMSLTGLKKDVAEFYGLENQPAVQIGDVVPGSPAEKAGLKRGQIITQLNGKPLERGDQPEEMPAILARNLRQMKVGAEIKLTVLSDTDKEPKQVTVTLEEQLKRANTARRFYDKDLGFGAREIVFTDTYINHRPADTKGVVITVIQPQGSSDHKLQANDLVVQLNGEPVTDLDQFKKSYEAFRDKSPKEAIVMVVLRASKEETIRIEPPQ